MKYVTEFRKVVTGQYINSATRITLAVIVPAVIMAHFGILKEYFAFPLGTSFLGLLDQPGSPIRRRNTLILGILSFFIVTLIIGLSYPYPILVVGEIILFGLFFSLIGIYGNRLAALGSLTLVVFAIFIDGHFGDGQALKTSLTVAAGGLWFLIVFLIVNVIQPYKLAMQMVGEHFIELAGYLRIRARFYSRDPDYNQLFDEMMTSQVRIKEHQEALRDLLFRTRRIVNESTTTSRIIMLLFIESIDLFEQIMTSQQDYRKLHEHFGHKEVLSAIEKYVNTLSSELVHIGIAVQAGQRTAPLTDLDQELQSCYEAYYNLRDAELRSETVERFIMLRRIMMGLSDITDKIKTVYRVASYDEKFAKSLSTGLDHSRFLPREESFNPQVLRYNLSLKSGHFRHAVRITVALLLGYIVSKLSFIEIGRSYWVLITILAIMKPSYAATKSRNTVRLIGTVAGAIAGFALLYFVHDSTALFLLLLVSMILSYTFLKERYLVAVFFMTVYLFITFNFLTPGNFEVIFRDRIVDTIIGGAITFAVSFFVFPVWEYTQNRSFIINAVNDNKAYFHAVYRLLTNKAKTDLETFKLRRKDAIISLANLSDNFQRMLSDPKNQQPNLKDIHQLVNTTHLLTAYIASLSLYAQKDELYPEVDSENWMKMIMTSFIQMQILLGVEGCSEEDLEPYQYYKVGFRKIETMLEKRRREVEEQEFQTFRDPNRISRLTEVKSINELFELIYGVVEEQRKMLQRLDALRGEVTAKQ